MPKAPLSMQDTASKKLLWGLASDGCLYGNTHRQTHGEKGATMRTMTEHRGKEEEREGGKKGGGEGCGAVKQNSAFELLHDVNGEDRVSSDSPHGEQRVSRTASSCLGRYSRPGNFCCKSVCKGSK